MFESFTDILKNGFRTWSSNLSVTAAYVSYYIILFFFIFLVAGGSFMVIGTSLGAHDLEILTAVSSAQTPDAALTEALYETLYTILKENIVLILAAVFILCAGYFLLAVWFIGGSTAMIRDATATGTCSFRSLFVYARKYFMVSLKAMLLFLAVALVFSGILAVVMIAVIAATALALMSVLSEGAVLAIGTVLGFLFGFLFSVVIYPLYFLVYAPILEDGRGGIEAASSFIRLNFRDVALLTLIYALIAVLVYLLSEIPLLSIVIFLLNMVVISPLLHIWAVRLYMSRTGKEIYAGENLTDF